MGNIAGFNPFIHADRSKSLGFFQTLQIKAIPGLHSPNTIDIHTYLTTDTHHLWTPIHSECKCKGL